MNANKTVTATFAQGQAPPRTLTVSKLGFGTGTVASSPTGVNCGATCSAQFNDGTSVTLTATPTGSFFFSSTFTGWSGCDSVNGNQCTVAMNADRMVTATFKGPFGF
jgi:hypothetical protein